mmetsp:Transcript_16403/g.66289  ORF Transcript_16403/g.66289 Transcript_16403/m.66289 type:complete len:232 (+) Transcript_16403:815-1510(+)
MLWRDKCVRVSAAALATLFDDTKTTTEFGDALTRTDDDDDAQSSSADTSSTAAKGVTRRAEVRKALHESAFAVDAHLGLLWSFVRCAPERRLRCRRWLCAPAPAVAAMSAPWSDLYKMLPLRSNEDPDAKKDFLIEMELEAENDSLAAVDRDGATLLWHACLLDDDLAVSLLLQDHDLRRLIRRRDARFHLEPHDVAALRGNVTACDVLYQFIDQKALYEDVVSPSRLRRW